MASHFALRSVPKGALLFNRVPGKVKDEKAHLLLQNKRVAPMGTRCKSYKSPGRNPVPFAIRANIFGPTSA
jgi:hypothetical protein